MGRSFKSEHEFVAWLRRSRQVQPPGLRLGIGDDASLVAPSAGREIILTADLSVEGVHFLRDRHPPDAVGHRALARSLSDVAAMGGRPRFALVSLALSQRVDRPWVEKFYRGLFRLAGRFGVAVVGGDTSLAAKVVMADVTVVGEVARGRALLRAGARPGDAIYVAGTLGLSAAGLRMLRSGSKPRAAAALRAHLYPEPQCRLGEFLVEKRLASAAIDISDGLSLDLSRLLEASGVGGRIHEEKIPVPPVATRGATALSLALDGGEDYKLLFTVPPSKVSRLPASFEGVRIYQMGKVCGKEQGILIEGRKGTQQLIPGGYDHFRRK
ncbi:MAG: thiamine-phosphate kinase [Terriglobia bacterium]